MENREVAECCPRFDPGPYQHVHKWIEETKRFVALKDKQIKKLFCYYTTCPKCAKKYGKNYVVILAQV